MKEKIENRIYRAAVYVRLSKEDGDKEESDSIVNQKDLIRAYLSDKPDISICMECVDDGFSGADFGRPGFQEMVREIEAGNIDCVVVKDLSRFGRNFVEAGRYIDQIFPSLGIRFIAVNDHFDSLNGRTSSDRILIPFKNLINDAYCRDISIKVRSQLETKRKKGDFIGSFAVYGYLKDPEDRHRLAVDEYAADVVRDIFRWKLEGASSQRIADRLNERGELSPMEYKRSCGLRFQSGFQVNMKTKWTAVAVKRILENEVYTGTMVQGKRTTPNHKVKKTILKPSGEWARVEGCHPAIISRDDFETVGRMLAQDMRVAPKEKEVYLLSGLVFCGDCGQNMVRNSVCKGGKSYVYYMCGNNRTNHACSSHRISGGLLEKAVFLSLKQHIGNLMDMEWVLECIERLPLQRQEIQKANARLAKQQEEAERYARLKRMLYESLVDGLVDKTEYLELKEVYDGKLREAQEAGDKLKEELQGLMENRQGLADWIGRFKEYRDIDWLDRRAVVSLIERIEVYEGKRIRIRFCYQDNYERVLAFIESVGQTHPLGETATQESVPYGADSFHGTDAFHGKEASPGTGNSRGKEVPTQKEGSCPKDAVDCFLEKEVV